MPAQPKTRIIIDILEEHLEELAFLWMQRQEAVSSPDYVERELSELDERIEAHLQGILVGGDAALPFIEEKLAGDRFEAFAAAYALLRLEDQAAADRLMEVFSAAEGEVLDGLREALCRGPIDLVLKKLEEAYRDGAAAVAAAAAGVFAAHDRLNRRPSRLDEFLSHEDPSVRCAGWRIVAFLGPSET